jgi:hypothetical protein
MLEVAMDFFNRPAKRRVVDPHEPIPVGEVEECDWEAWADSVGFQDSKPMDFQMTEKLPITREEGDSIDVFACVTKKGQ